MFVGRKRELETLNELYDKNTYQMVVMYGRRRVGKTTLIMKFIEDKPAVFFSAQEAGDKLNLEIFTRKIFEFFQVPSSLGGFPTWGDALDFLAERAKSEHFVVAIDEFPYAAEGNKSLKSILQNAIDHSFKDTKIFILLCGSQTGFMENEVLGHKSPLFGRRTAQMKIERFDCIDAAKMLPSYGCEDWIRFYACIGGTPHYLNQIDASLDFNKNVAALFFRASGYLYDEPVMLLKQELREPAMYNAIVAAIAQGASKLNEISTKTGEERSKTIKYIDPLMKMGILHRELPFGDDREKSRKGLYRISDNCFSFWYRYVFPNRSGIEQGTGELLFASIQDELNAYIGRPFEEICMQYMIRRNNRSALPFLFAHAGRWWGSDPKTKRQEEIDLIFSSLDGKSAIFAECKWRNEVNDVSVLNALMNKSQILRASGRFRDVYYYLFSKAVFSKECRTLAKKLGNVFLAGLDDLFAV